MNSLTSIINSLEPLGLYNLTQGSNIYNEIASYAYALDFHIDNIDKALASSTITTSSRDDIAERESLFGYSRTELSDSKRREMLINRLLIDNNAFTLSGFCRFLDSLGVTGYLLTESPSQMTFTVTINGSYSEKLKEWFRKQIIQFAPAHCECTVNFA